MLCPGPAHRVGASRNPMLPCPYFVILLQLVLFDSWTLTLPIPCHAGVSDFTLYAGQAKHLRLPSRKAPRDVALAIFTARVETQSPATLQALAPDDGAPKLEINTTASLAQLKRLLFKTVDHSVAKKALKHGQFDQLGPQPRAANDTEGARRAAQAIRSKQRRNLLLNLLIIYAEGTVPSSLLFSRAPPAYFSMLVVLSGPRAPANG